MKPDVQNAPSDLVGLYRSLSRRMEPLPSDLGANLRQMQGIRAVLFDIYGTLLISASGDIDAASSMDPAEAFAGALRSCGLSPSAGAGAAGAAMLEDEIRQCHAALRANGRECPEVDILSAWTNVAKRLHDAGLIAPGADEGTLARLAIERECRVNPVWVMPGAPETLALLRKRGTRLGIVSNAQFFTPIAIEALFGMAPAALGFDRKLTAWSYQLGEAKPGLSLFRGPLEKLKSEGYAPDQIAFVGNDCLNDLFPAHALGMRPILFAGDRRSLRLREVDPRCEPVRRQAPVITDLLQLPEILA